MASVVQASQCEHMLLSGQHQLAASGLYEVGPSCWANSSQFRCPYITAVHLQRREQLSQSDVTCVMCLLCVPVNDREKRRGHVRIMRSDALVRDIAGRAAARCWSLPFYPRSSMCREHLQPSQGCWPGVTCSCEQPRTPADIPYILEQYTRACVRTYTTL